MGQLLTRQSHTNARTAVSVLIAAVLALVVGCRRTANTPASPAGGAVTRGGEIVASVHSDPRSFNRFVARDSTTDLVATLTQARLVRLNRVTQEVEPWLAESWTRSGDGLRYTLKLRPDVTFSDGHPFTSDDVVFSFDAVYDENNGSVLGNALQVGGKDLAVTAPDPLTVIVTFPELFAPGVRLLDNLPILPRHKLGAALKDSTFARAWSLQTPPEALVGLGPFVVSEYVPGQRMVFTRNARYWRKDMHGAALPYLDRITLQIVPEQDSELLRLEAGQLDMTATEMRPEDYTPLKRAADAGRVVVLDLGVGFDADSLWFNLKPGGLGQNDPRAAWLQHEALRRAISMAVDRERFANTVFLGAGVPVYGPITPANRKWYAGLPVVPHDLARATRELASIGLLDRNGDGLLEDGRNQPVRFSLLAQKGNTSIERGAAVIREELKKIGVTVDVLALDANAVIQRFLTGHYDAVFYRVTATDSDPAINPDFWFSSGSAHVWNLEQQSPATDWEARIDGLMRRQIASSDDAERRRLFAEVQQIFAEHLPMIQFVAPRIYVARSTRTTNLTPTAFSRPQLLWSPDTIAVVH
jgi:peptide/nickel transport system substrate-binding protein